MDYFNNHLRIERIEAARNTNKYTEDRSTSTMAQSPGCGEEPHFPTTRASPWRPASSGGRDPKEGGTEGTLSSVASPAGGPHSAIFCWPHRPTLLLWGRGLHNCDSGGGMCGGTWRLATSLPLPQPLPHLSHPYSPWVSLLRPLLHEVPGRWYMPSWTTRPSHRGWAELCPHCPQSPQPSPACMQPLPETDPRPTWPLH